MTPDEKFKAFLAENPDLDLTHYGVKGMKWGVRRSKKQLAKAAKKAKKASKGGRDQSTTKYKTSPAKLTDKELQRRINRLQSEKKYNELNARKLSKTEQTIQQVLTDAGKQTATRAVAAATMYAVMKGIEKKYGAKVAKEMFPKKK